MSRRCLYMPYVTFTNSPEMVIIRTPTDDPNTYFETVMAPEEAKAYALQLMIDADRAASYRAARRREAPNR